MNPHDEQPRDEQPRDGDPAEATDLAGPRPHQAGQGGDDDVVADDVEPAATPPAPVPGPDNERVWYPL